MKTILKLLGYLTTLLNLVASGLCFWQLRSNLAEIILFKQSSYTPSIILWLAIILFFYALSSFLYFLQNTDNIRIRKGFLLLFFNLLFLGGFYALFFIFEKI